MQALSSPRSFSHLVCRFVTHQPPSPRMTCWSLLSWNLRGLAGLWKISWLLTQALQVVALTFERRLIRCCCQSWNPGKNCHQMTIERLQRWEDFLSHSTCHYLQTGRCCSPQSQKLYLSDMAQSTPIQVKTSLTPAVRRVDWTSPHPHCWTASHLYRSACHHWPNYNPSATLPQYATTVVRS